MSTGKENPRTASILHCENMLRTLSHARDAHDNEPQLSPKPTDNSNLGDEYQKLKISNQELLTEVTNLQNIVKSLQEQDLQSKVHALTLENQKLLEQLNQTRNLGKTKHTKKKALKSDSSEPQGQGQRDDFSTDEDELVYETTGKRKAPSPPERNSKKPKDVVTRNHALFTSGSSNTVDNINSTQRKPPPIFVRNLQNINLLITEISRLSKNDSTIKIPLFKSLANGEVKISCDDENNFREITNLLRHYTTTTEHALHNLEYYTYQCKSDKPFRVVIRGLNPSMEERDIINELGSLGHNAIKATNVQIKKKVNGKPVKVCLPLFFVELTPDVKNKEIYGLDHMLYSKVKVEPPRLRKEIPQCKNCQDFGHTKAYCHRKPKCVKCGNQHPTEDCTKSRKTASKCANCDGDHTANWKGCPYYKGKLAARQTPVSVTQRVQTKPKTTDVITPGKSFASVAAGKPENQVSQKGIEQSTGATIGDVISMLQSISNRLDRLEKVVLVPSFEVKGRKK